MNKINFEPIGEALKAFDTDKIDIARRLEIENPDGTTGETSQDVPIYTDISCHISFDNVDNPDENTVDSEPIITMLTINCPVDVDLQKGDYITAYKLNNAGETIAIYVGIIGYPEINQSRQSAQMQMKTGV